MAAKHHLQVTDDHFSKAVRNPVQQPAVLPRTGSQSEFALNTQAPVLQRDAADCEMVPERQAPRVGLEQSEDSPRRVQVSETTGAKSGAVDRENARIDPDLDTVIDTWHSLPPDTRTAILAIVEAAQRR